MIAHEASIHPKPTRGGADEGMVVLQCRTLHIDDSGNSARMNKMRPFPPSYPDGSDSEPAPAVYRIIHELAVKLSRGLLLLERGPFPRSLRI